MFTLKNILFEEQILTIRFSSEKYFESLTSEIRLKDMTRYAVGSYTQFSEIKVTGRPDEYELRLPYSLFTEQFVLKNLSRQVVWIYIYNGEDYYELKVDQKLKEEIRSKNPVKLNNLAHIRPMNKGTNMLALNITKCNVMAELDDIEIRNDAIQLTIKGNENFPLNNIYLKKRIFKDTLVYSEDILLERMSSNEFLLSYAELDKLYFDTVTNLDFLAEFKDRNITIEVPLVINNELKGARFKFNEFINSKLYITTNKYLSIRAEKHDPSVTIQRVSDHSMTVDLSSISKDLLPELKCGLFKVSQVINDEEVTLYKNVESKLDGLTLALDISMDDIFSGIDAKQEQLYTMMLYADSEMKNSKYRLSHPEGNEFMLDYSNFAVKCLIGQDCRFIIQPVEKAPIRLSILGSCYSRAPFNSSNPYFNPDYKKYFRINYSHFWISLISATSEAIEFDNTLYKDVPKKVMMNIAREYEKTTFEELQKSASDYVILDFFVDAVHGCRKLPDGRYIGQNGDMHQSHYYKHHLLKETSQFDNRDPDFWRVWQSACDEFIIRLLEVVDKDKIILNWGGLTDEYINEKGQVSSFSKDKKFNKTDIKFINHTWNKMNDYFIAKVPSTKVIDLRKNQYKASLDYPYGGKGPHHYESNYYKSFLGELSKLVLGDKVNQ